MQNTALDYVSIVENHPSKAAIDGELRLLDDRLFLDAEMDPDFGCLVWCVKYALGAGQEPLLILDWRDPDTRVPLDLSWGLWSRVKAREHRDPYTLRDEIKAENAKRSQMHSERQSAAYEEMIADMVPRMSGKQSANVHRGVGLRMARDRQRARGRNV